LEDFDDPQELDSTQITSATISLDFSFEDVNLIFGGEGFLALYELNPGTITTCT
jgi:hypothetical protein